MKTSARNATLFISFLFIFFNGVQVYLIFQRIAGTKAKFNVACTNALLSTLFEYNKLNGTDTASKPKHALISWSLNEIAVNRLDSQIIALRSPSSRLYAMRVNPATIEALVSRPKSGLLDLPLLDSLYGRALDSFKDQGKQVASLLCYFSTASSCIWFYYLRYCQDHGWKICQRIIC